MSDQMTEVSTRYYDIIARLRPDEAAMVKENNRMAMTYVWGWQDARGEERDTLESQVFGRMFGIVSALHMLNKCAGPNIASAFKSFRESGHIMDWHVGELRALDLLPAV